MPSEQDDLRGRIAYQKALDTFAADLRCLRDALDGAPEPPRPPPPLPAVPVPASTSTNAFWRPGLDPTALGVAEERTFALLAAELAEKQTG